MMQTDPHSELVRSTPGYDALPPRDRMPTLPEDLSEYAWIHTGPESWSNMSAESELELGDDDLLDFDAETSSEQRALDALSAGRLVDLWHSDIPKVIAKIDDIVDEREAAIVALIDGRATIGMLLETSGLPLPDVLGAIGELCTRGVIDLDRSQRRAR
jgi:hypothetical protein